MFVGTAHSLDVTSGLLSTSGSRFLEDFWTQGQPTVPLALSLIEELLVRLWWAF